MIPEYIPAFLRFPALVEDRVMGQVDWVWNEGVPRREYWSTTKGESYTYGRGRGQRTYEPNANVPVIEALRGDVERHFNMPFEGCFLNCYDDGKDALGWHADDDPAIDHTRPIVVVSLGAPRCIHWRANGEKGTGSINKQLLAPGSMFVMPAGMQQTHKHSIPKAPQLMERRISFTFRGLL